MQVPHDRGLAGHSDGDVLTHAVADALIGALGRGDIGQWFPDTDERYQGINSLQLLRSVSEALAVMPKDLDAQEQSMSKPRQQMTKATLNRFRKRLTDYSLRAQALAGAMTEQTRTSIGSDAAGNLGAEVSVPIR